MSDLDSFEYLAKQKIFIIPTNQRGFSWIDKNFIELITDLETADSRDHNHYLGPIIINCDGPTFREDSGNQTTPFVLEDGQQRVTSIFFILKAIQEQMILLLEGQTSNETDRIDQILYYQRPGSEKKIRIENKNQALNDFLAKWFDDRLPDINFETSPMKSMRNARIWCNEEFKKSHLSTMEACNNWKNRILNNAKFIIFL